MYRISNNIPAGWPSTVAYIGHFNYVYANIYSPQLVYLLSQAHHHGDFQFNLSLFDSKRAT